MSSQHPSTIAQRKQAGRGRMSGEQFATLVESDRRSIMHPFSALAEQSVTEPRILESASGIYLKDAKGKEYIDGGSGLWCVNVGYGRSEIADVMAEQSRKLSYSLCFASYSNEPMIQLAQRMLELAPPNMVKVLFNNGGSEANEAQIKMVRAYNNILGRPHKKKIISRWGGYHGATIAAGSLTGNAIVHRLFDLPIEGILHAESPDYHRRKQAEMSPADFAREAARALEQMIIAQGPDTIAAFIAEPIMGSCGIIIPPLEYFEAIEPVLQRHDVLLIADEVITGFGRAGHWFASPHFRMRPDLITCAKGITSGYFPMSACLVGDRVWEVLTSDRGSDNVFGHGFTTAGHPVAAAVALKNIEIMERESLLSNASTVGGYLLDRLRSKLGTHSLVGDVRGYGMLCGVELDADKAARRPFENAYSIGGMLGRLCWDEGLVVRGGHGKAMGCLAPPLILTTSEADEIVTRLGRALDRLASDLQKSGLWQR
jgi:L-2,4-diaminobutyrate transaminase